MTDSTLPIVLIVSFETAKGQAQRVVLKSLVASLLRSLFSGKIMLFRTSAIPLFKVERSQIGELTISHLDLGSGALHAKIQTLNGMRSHFASNPDDGRQWVIVMSSAGLALRNIDHLIPPDLPGPYPPPEVDFYWASSARDANCGNRMEATSGIWAVRKRFFTQVVDHWLKIAEIFPREAEDTIWTRVVEGLPLRKRRFEAGEILAPRRDSLDWQTLNDAAFVTIPDWPLALQAKFLQALYFGTYLGDDSGMMLDVLND